MSQQRNVGVDALKIASMFMVLTLHVLGQGGVLETTPSGSLRWAGAWLLEVICYGAVDQFALASGYVGVLSHHRPSNILSLWMQVFLYSVAISVIGYVISPSLFGIGQLLHAVLPISFGVYWYMTAYVLTMLIAPAIDSALHRYGDLPNRCIIVLFLFFFSFIPTFTGIEPNHLGLGYSFVWIAFLYYLGGYIRIYKGKNERPVIFSILIAIACYLFTWIFTCLKHLQPLSFSEMSFLSYLSPTILLPSLLHLEEASKFKVGERAATFCAWAVPATLDIYLIHVHPVPWTAFVKNRFVALSLLPSYVLPLAVLSSAIVAFFILLLVGRLRTSLFRAMDIRGRLRAVDELWASTIAGSSNPS